MVPQERAHFSSLLACLQALLRVAAAPFLPHASCSVQPVCQSGHNNRPISVQGLVLLSKCGSHLKTSKDHWRPKTA